MFDATGSTGIPACMSRIAGVSASLPCLVDVGQVTNKKADLWRKIGSLRCSREGVALEGRWFPPENNLLFCCFTTTHHNLPRENSRLREIVRFLDFLAQWEGIKWGGYLSGFLAFFEADLAE